MSAPPLEEATVRAISEAFKISPSEIERAVRFRNENTPVPQYCGWPVGHSGWWTQCSRNAGSEPVDGIPACWQHSERFRTTVTWWLLSQAPVMHVVEVAEVLASRATSDAGVLDHVKEALAPLLDMSGQIKAIWGESA